MQGGELWRCIRRGRLIASAFLIAAVWLCGVSYGWTTPGSENDTNSGGNYPLGCPMGGIGGGNFNFLPNGAYNTTLLPGSGGPRRHANVLRFPKAWEQRSFPRLYRTREA